jgi:hypothetical protein
MTIFRTHHALLHGLTVNIIPRYDLDLFELFLFF